jgi:hypothetical protein
MFVCSVREQLDVSFFYQRLALSCLKCKDAVMSHTRHDAYLLCFRGNSCLSEVIPTMHATIKQMLEVDFLRNPSNMPTCMTMFTTSSFGPLIEHFYQSSV